MAALVQSYPQQSSTVTMLQTRPSSSSGIIHSSQPQIHHQYPTTPQAMKRNSFHGMNSGMGVSTYRGQTAVTPIAPYAFTSTPNLAMPGQRIPNGPHLQQDQRTSSAPNIPTAGSSARSRYPAPPSTSTTSSSSSDLSSLSQKSGSKDDSVITGTARVVSGAARPQSSINTSVSAQSFVPPTASPVKASPERYRRPNNRRAESASAPAPAQITASSASMPNVMQFYGSSVQPSAAPAATQNLTLQMPQLSQSTSGFAPNFGSADDMQLKKNAVQDPTQRYRRRSIHTIDAGDFGGMSGSLLQQGSRQVSSANGRIDQQHYHQQHPLRSSPVVVNRPNSSHARNGSTESVNSARSNHSRPSSVSRRLCCIFTLLFCSPLLSASLSLTAPRSSKSHRSLQFSQHQSQQCCVHFANPLMTSGPQARSIHGTKPRPIFILAISSSKCLGRTDFNQTRCTTTCKYSSPCFIHRCRETSW